MALRLAAVTLVVPDYDAAIRFYVDRLGFTLMTDEDQGHGKRWVLVLWRANRWCLPNRRAGLVRFSRLLFT